MCKTALQGFLGVICLEELWCKVCMSSAVLTIIDYPCQPAKAQLRRSIRAAAAQLGHPSRYSRERSVVGASLLAARPIWTHEHTYT